MHMSGQSAFLDFDHGWKDEQFTLHLSGNGVAGKKYGDAHTFVMYSDHWKSAVLMGGSAGTSIGLSSSTNSPPEDFFKLNHAKLTVVYTKGAVYFHNPLHEKTIKLHQNGHGVGTSERVYINQIPASWDQARFAILNLDEHG